jgi:hypothetical protein
LESLTAEQFRLVVVVYTSALVPLVVIPLLHWRKLIPSWILPVYIASFIVCALGWEIWFNYGLAFGDSVVDRRSIALTQRIPLHLNWILNSLADAGTVCCGGLLLVWVVRGRRAGVFRDWSWSVLWFLMLFFVAQNVIVELFLYHDQLSVGKFLSWAPLSPLGSWFNPVLFHFYERTVSLQSQIPWVIMTPLFYAGVLRCVREKERPTA